MIIPESKEGHLPLLFVQSITFSSLFWLSGKEQKWASLRKLFQKKIAIRDGSDIDDKIFWL